MERLLQDKGIVRHRRKIESVINNAKRAIALADEFGSLSAYFWRYEPRARHKPLDYMTLLALDKTDASTALSKDLKKRGWSFVGTTTAYALMQSVGMVNDHVDGCEWWAISEALRRKFQRPTV